MERWPGFAERICRRYLEADSDRVRARAAVRRHCGSRTSGILRRKLVPALEWGRAVVKTSSPGERRPQL